MQRIFRVQPYMRLVRLLCRMKHLMFHIKENYSRVVHIMINISVALTMLYSTDASLLCIIITIFVFLSSS